MSTNIYAKLKAVENTKKLIRSAIENKGGSISDSDPFRVYADKILEFEVTSGSASDKFKTLNVKPTGEEFVVTAEEKNCSGFNSVTVAGDTNLVPDNIRSGVKVYGMTGAYRGENASVLAAECIPIIDGTSHTQYPEQGYDGFKKVTVKSEKNLKPENIKEGVTIYGCEGTFAGGGGGGGGIRGFYLTKITGEVNVNSIHSQQLTITEG